MAERQLVASPGEVLEAEEVDDEVQQYLERSSANTSQNDDSDSLASDPDSAAAEHPEAASATPDIHKAGFLVGLAQDRNRRYRRSMEDAHSYHYNFGNVKGAGFFAIFDGHAGKSTAEYCSQHLHELLLEYPDIPIPAVLSKTFLLTDHQLSEKKGLFSGATAIVAHVRNEERPAPAPASTSTSSPPPPTSTRRVLYTANAGDSRAVLCRGGQARRLSFDHKGSDVNEVQRIVEAGGFVMNNRVNGVLAVTRSLGDIAMKEWVIGNPYTTETVMDDDDSCLILACDGLWDVCSDQVAVDLIKDMKDPQAAADALLEHALNNMSTDNLSVMVVLFDKV